MWFGADVEVSVLANIFYEVEFGILFKRLAVVRCAWWFRQHDPTVQRDLVVNRIEVDRFCLGVESGISP